MSLEPRNRAQRKLIAAARRSAAQMPPDVPPAFFVTDPERTPDPCRVARGLPTGFGVIYRHFGARDRLEVAVSLARICRVRGLALLIAADPALAKRIGADGVHWPFRMRNQTRRWRFAVQTVSAHSERELRVAASLPVEAVLLSTVFASRSASAGRAMGAVKFRMLVRAADLPVYALGGITADNACIAAEFAGFAAVEGMRPFEKAED